MQKLFFSGPLQIVEDGDNVFSKDIHLLLQFYVDKNAQRQKEIVYCLHENLRNPFITRIHLLNEKEYSLQEMEIEDDIDKELAGRKLTQFNIGKRIQYRDFFSYVRHASLEGYCMIANSDIVFDQSLAYFAKEIALCDPAHPAFLALLRYEMTPKDPTLFGPRYDSQDVWTLHSKHIPSAEYDRLFGFEMGKPGCDNKLIYLFGCLLAYRVINDPLRIKTYHIHFSQQRNYTHRDVLPRPFGFIVPYGIDMDSLRDSMGMSWQRLMIKGQGPHECIAKLQKAANSKPMIVSRISSLVSMYACYTKMTQAKEYKSVAKSLLAELQKPTNLALMKRDKGIAFQSTKDLAQFADTYFAVLSRSSFIAIEDTEKSLSHEYLYQSFPFPKKEYIWSGILESWHCLRQQPWLCGLRLLIICEFPDRILAQWQKKELLFGGKEIFPECTLITCSSPARSLDSISYFEESYCIPELEPRLSHFDVALVSAGGWSSLILNYCAENGKSAIDLGKRLDSFFGIGNRQFMSKRPDAYRLYMNQHWMFEK